MMIRRQFLKLASLASATGLASLGAVEALRDDPQSPVAGQCSHLTWQVHGFTCVTCAVGLETMLGRMPGVASVHATYPEGVVQIAYAPARVSEDRLRAAISDLGFRV
jgi:copper chaperone CopZ